MTALEKWLEGRPEPIKVLARCYPPGTRFLLHGEILHVIGYGYTFDEKACLELSPHNPSINYRKAINTRRLVCPCCMENLDRHRLR